MKRPVEPLVNWRKTASGTFAWVHDKLDTETVSAKETATGKSSKSGKPGSVYFFQIAQIAEGLISPIKIGFTRSSPGARCRDIEMYLPWKLNFLGAFHCISPEREENALKRRLAAHRIKGEWFEAGPALRALRAMAARLPPCGFNESPNYGVHEDRLLMRIPVSLKKAIVRRAQRNGTSITKVVISEIEKYLASNP